LAEIVGSFNSTYMVWQEVFDNHVKVLMFMLFIVACCDAACMSKFKKKYVA